jgi:predicted Zn-dependent protease with MMP-like domain
MRRQRFARFVEEALATIPADFRARLDNVDVVVEDAPSPEVLRQMDVPPGETLFGLYQGTPLTERGWAYGNALPDRIVIYQRPIETACETEDDVFDEICLTLIHEAGHYFGLGEDEIEAIEDEFWYGRSGAGPGEDDDDAS